MDKKSTAEPLSDRLVGYYLGLRNRHFVVADLVIFCVTPVIALSLRTDGFDGIDRYVQPLALYILVAVALRFGVFVVTGIYGHLWRFASIEELGQIALSTLGSMLLIAAVYFVLLRPLGIIPESLPRTLPFIDSLLAGVLVGITRYSVRYVYSQRERGNHLPGAKRVAIIGAGGAGALIVREMQSNPQLAMKPVAFLDDDASKRRTSIHGVPVIGDRYRIGSLVEDYKVDQAIIAMPTAPGKTIREIVQLCEQARLPVMVVPGVYELLDGKAKVERLRQVEITDLLRREPVRTDFSAVTALLTDQVVLITGAGGSIGGELCRQIARCRPAGLVLLGHGENSLFYQSHELKALFPELCHEVVVADVRDERRIDNVVRRVNPKIIFHAAAHKHVSLMEDNVEDAVTNNVLGTRVMVQAGLEHGVKHLLLISSDKAVRPVSVMGATKHVAEMLVYAAARASGQHYVSVRFGNVLGSRGSVVPLFKQQIAQGGPVTVTHAEVRRFFMTIPEAVQLVLQAATIGRGGETFALDMGEPIKIIDLAYDLIRLSGLQLGRDIDIKITGLRPGEKLYEELFVPGETYERTLHEKIFVARNGNSGLDHARQIFYDRVDELVKAAGAGDPARVRALLAEIVPDFQPNGVPQEVEG